MDRMMGLDGPRVTQREVIVVAPQADMFHNGCMYNYTMACGHLASGQW